MSPAPDPPGAGETEGAAPDAPLPEAVRDLIARCIDTVAQLEALLLLHNEPQVRWDPAAVARRLYIGEADATAVLRHLRQCGLATVDGEHWRFETAEPAAAQAVALLAALYSRRLIAITALIHGKKARGIHEFARAFVLRRDKP